MVRCEKLKIEFNDILLERIASSSKWVDDKGDVFLLDAQPTYP